MVGRCHVYNYCTQNRQIISILNITPITPCKLILVSKLVKNDKTNQ